jgi:hypothetical protein
MVSPPVVMFCAPGLDFDGTEGVGLRFLVLRARTRHRRFRGRRVPFSYFTCQTLFQRYRARHVPFSYFARPDSFSAVLRSLGPVFMFCAPDLFSAVQRVSCPDFKICAPRLIFGCAECVGSLFHVLRSRTHFRRYRGRLVPITCFVLSNAFSAVPSASGPVLMFCTPGIVFGGTGGVGSRFLILRALTHFRRYRGGVGSHFHVLPARTLFRRYRGRLVSISCFARRDSFSTVLRASGPVFMFCAPGLIFSGS